MKLWSWPKYLPPVGFHKLGGNNKAISIPQHHPLPEPLHLTFVFRNILQSLFYFPLFISNLDISKTLLEVVELNCVLLEVVNLILNGLNFIYIKVICINYFIYFGIFNTRPCIVNARFISVY